MKKVFFIVLVLLSLRASCNIIGKNTAMDIATLESPKLKSDMIRARQKDEKIQALAKEYEEVLTQTLWQQVNKDLIKPNPYFGGGKGEKMFNEMLNNERAKVIDLKLAKHIEEQLLKQMEGKNGRK